MAETIWTLPVVPKQHDYYSWRLDLSWCQTNKQTYTRRSKQFPRPKWPRQTYLTALARVGRLHRRLFMNRKQSSDQDVARGPGHSPLGHRALRRRAVVVLVESLEGPHDRGTAIQHDGGQQQDERRPRPSGPPRSWRHRDDHCDHVTTMTSSVDLPRRRVCPFSGCSCELCRGWRAPGCFVDTRCTLCGGNPVQVASSDATKNTWIYSEFSW